MIEDLGIAIVNGVLRGSVYALVALGLVLVYRATGVFNFAQTEFGTTALFAAYVALEVWEWRYLYAFLFGILVALAMGLLTERLVIHPLRNSSRVTLLVGTAGVALAAIGIQFWQSNEQPILSMPRIVEGVAFAPFGAAVMWQQLITLGVLVGVALWLAAFFKSPSGVAIQAAQQEPAAAELVGISVRRVSMMTWGIAAVLGGLAGVLSGPNLTFTAGFLSFGAGAALLPGLMAAVIAGMRSMPGALAGGLLIGVIEQLGFIGVFANLDIPGAGAALLFLFLLVALLARPQGLLVRDKAVV